MLSSAETLLGPRTVERVQLQPLLRSMPEFLRKLPSLEEAYKHLECPVCLTVQDQITDVPYLNCVNGHGICLTCFDRLDTKDCPLCKSPMSRAENFAIEQGSLRCNFKCTNPGCNVVETGSTIREHMAKCQFKQYLSTPPKIISRKTYVCVQYLQEQLPEVVIPGVPTPARLVGFPFDPFAPVAPLILSQEPIQDHVQPTSHDSAALVSWEDCTNASFPRNGIYASVIKVQHAGSGQPLFRKIYVAKAFKGRRLLGGRFIPNECGVVVYNSDTKKSCKMSQYYKILTRAPETKVEWIDHIPGSMIPNGCVKSHTGVNEEIYYVARAKLDIENGYYTAGFCVPSHGCCYIGKGRSVFTQRAYQVLVVSLRE